MKPHAWIVADKIAQKPRVILDADEADELIEIGQDHVIPVFTEKDMAELAYEVRLAVLNQEIDEVSDISEFVKQSLGASK